MLRNHPGLKHILGRAGWYLITFLFAVVINFILPRLGPANPVDVIMGKLSQQDFDQMAGRLRARAMGVMKQLDGGITSEPAAVQVGRVAKKQRGECGCGVVNDHDAKFCKSCGAKLVKA